MHISEIFVILSTSALVSVVIYTDCAMVKRFFKLIDAWKKCTSYDCFKSVTLWEYVKNRRIKYLTPSDIGTYMVVIFANILSVWILYIGYGKYFG